MPGRTQTGTLGDERAEVRVRAEHLGDGVGIGVEVEERAQPLHGRRQVADVGEPHPRVQPALRLGRLVDLGHARPAGQGERAPVGAGATAVARDHLLDARHRTQRQEVEDGCGVERLTVGQAQRYDALHDVAAALLGPQLGRGHRVHLADRVVELAHAGETGRERDLGRAEVGGLQQQPGGLRPLGAGERERARTEFGVQLAGQVAVAVAEPRGEPGHALAVDHAVGDQAHRAPDQVGAEVPLRGAGRGVGPAAPAGPEAGGLGGRGGRVESDVLSVGGSGGAAGSTVDAGGPHSRVEHPVEAGVLAAHRPVTGVFVHPHALQSAASAARALAGIGHGSGGGPDGGIFTFQGVHATRGGDRPP